MSSPNSLEEFNARFLTNQRVSGYGLDTSMTVPCPFCAAPNFMEYKIMEMQAVVSQEHVCSECGRGAKTLFSKIGYATTFMETVQTQGDPSPGWLVPTLRRIES